MQTSTERRRLAERYDETPDLLVVLGACIGGLLLVTGLVTLAALPEGETWRDASSTQDERTAEGHRKQVFDERRKVYLGGADIENLADRPYEASIRERTASTPQ